MVRKRDQTSLYSWFLASMLILMLALCACGPAPAPLPAAPAGQPDRLRLSLADTPGAYSSAIITDKKTVQQLYTQLYAQPWQSGDETCPAIADPTYLLSFQQGTKQLSGADLSHGGCPHVEIYGEPTSKPRQLSESYWTKLFQAAKGSAATTDVTSVSMQPISSQKESTPRIAQITSSVTTQQLYHAIQALPKLTSEQACTKLFEVDYQLAFHSATQVIQVSIDDTTCNEVTLHSIGTEQRYSINAAFKQLFQHILATTTFAAAQSDTFVFSEVAQNKPTNIQDQALIHNLYQQSLTLSNDNANPGGCPFTDDNKEYVLLFTQWDLPLQYFSITESGACKDIYNMVNHTRLQGGPEFWNLIHSASKRLPTS